MLRRNIYGYTISVNMSSCCYWDKTVTPSWKGHFSLPQSVHKMLSRWVRKPRPTSETAHCTQAKHSLCHWRSSKEMYFAPARPAHIKQRSIYLHNVQVNARYSPCLPHSSYTNANKGFKYERENSMSGVRLHENMRTASDSLVMGLVQPTHFFAYRLLKQSRQ